MINMAVIRLKDIIKYLVGMTLVLAIIMSITRYFSNIEVKKQEGELKSGMLATAQKLTQNPMTSCLGTTIAAMSLKEETEEVQDTQTNKEKKSVHKTILGTELAMMQAIKEKEDVSAIPQEKSVDKEKPIEQAKSDASAGESKDTIENKFTNTYGSVKIKNESKYDLTEEMLTPNIELSDKKEVLIFHTHTCESYTASEKYNYVPTGSYRTTDLNFTVARVGTELENQLKSYGKTIVHDQSYHDYPAYSGSYNRSLATVNNRLKENPNTQVVIDLHRDAVGSASDYAPTVKIGEEEAAKLMFVMGTNGGGLEHSNWNQNLKFAVKVQEKANELYPGLFKPIILRNSRYNQQVTNAASIIEVGATGNTLDQCLVSMKYLAKVMNEVMKE